MSRAVASSLLAKLLGVAALVGAIGCATPPKPPELDAFEKLRNDPGVPAAQKKAPDLVKGADRLLKQSREDWQGNDLKESRSAALLGQIKLKHALALADQDEAKRRVAEADEKLDEAEEEEKRLQKDMVALNEQVALLKRLTAADADKQRLAQELQAQQQRATEQAAVEKAKDAAQEKVSEAERAIQAADNVKASEFAKVPYSSAKDNLTRAQQEVAQGNFKAAETSAAMARTKAVEAAAAAKAPFEAEAQSAESKQRAESLMRDAAAIPGIVVKRDQRGTLQRIVLPVGADSLFNRRETMVAPGKDAILDPIAALMKKYATFPVQVVGYTDTRGRAGELLALSLARAQAVFSALVTRGADPKRLVVSGQGGAEPVSDNRTSPGRTANNRVEIIFLYQ